MNNYNDQIELLFFDTFAHESNEELNLDLVQFPRPVYITEVRVIPLGARVQADFPGGDRLGATNPSQFQLEFFVNDLSRSGASSFESLGSLEYKQSNNIHLVCDRKIPTDGLILRGWYSIITLAVYGAVTRVTPSVDNPPVEQGTAVNSTQSNEGGDDNTSLDWSALQKLDNVVTPVCGEGYQSVAYSGFEGSAYIQSWEQDDDEKSECWDQCASPDSNISEKDRPEVRSDSRLEPRSDSRLKKATSRDRDRNSSEREHSYGGSEREYGDHSSSARRRGRDKGREGRESRYLDRRTGDLDYPGERNLTPDRYRRTPDKDRKKGSDRVRYRSKDRDSTPDRKERRTWDQDKEGFSSNECLTKDQAEWKTPPEPPTDSGSDNKVFEPLSPGDVEAISDEEMPDEPEVEASDIFAEELIEESASLEDRVGPQPGQEIDEYEEILSDEDMMDDEQQMSVELDYEMGEEWEDLFKSFNPYSAEIQPLVYFTDPSLTSFEVETRKLVRNDISSDLSGSAQKLLEVTEFYPQGEISEKWVEAVESVLTGLPQALTYLLHQAHSAGIVDILLAWTKLGLDYDKAFLQSLPPFKVRHLKVGIRLVTALCNCSTELTRRLLISEAHLALLELFNKEHMAHSLLLMSFRALDMITRSKMGMDLCLGYTSLQALKEEIEISDSPRNANINVSKPSLYESLIEMLMRNPPARAKIAISALIKKAHLYETLQQLQKFVEEVVERQKTEGDEIQPVRRLHSKFEVDDSPNNQPYFSLSQNDVSKCVTILTEILKVYCFAPSLIGQPSRVCTLKVHFQIPSCPYDPYPGLFNLFQATKLLECLLVLITCPATHSQQAIIACVYDILFELLQSQKGLLYLCSCADVTSVIMKALFQEGGEGSEDSLLHQLGLQMAYNTQVLLQIDGLMEFHVNNPKLEDETEALQFLNYLYNIMFSPMGKLAVVNVLSQEQNLKCILPFIEAYQGKPEKSYKNSAAWGYAADLLILTVKYSENVTALERFGDKVYQICCKDSESKLNQLISWLDIIQIADWSGISAVTALCDIVKKHIDQVMTFPGQLITALRVLKHLSVPSTPKVSKELHHDETQTELRYQYAIIQIYHQDMVTDFMKVISTVCETYQHPFLHSCELIGHHGALIISVVKPVVQILGRILSHAIACRGTDYRDLTPINSLLKLYTLMNAYPVTSLFYVSTIEVQQDVVDILLSYTQPIVDATESEEVLTKSLWTKMVQEVVSYITSAPYTFLSGLQVLAELLPLPLPITVPKALTSNETASCIKFRKLWAAHLHGVSGSLNHLVATLGCSSYSPLLQLLRRVCSQLADLAAPTALLVTRALLDATLTSLKTEVSLDTIYILSFLGSMLGTSSIKAAALQIIRGETKSEEKFKEVIPNLVTHLNSSHDNTALNVQLQENILGIFLSLCDCDIVLGGATPQEAVANALPQRDQLNILTVGVVDHLADSNRSYSTLLLALRICVTLTDTDYTWYHLCSVLQKKDNVLNLIMSKLVRDFNKDSSDCLSVLSTFVELLRLLHSTESSVETDVTARTQTLPIAEIAKLVCWHTVTQGSQEEESTHSLLQLQNLLTENGKEDESLESVLTSLNNLIQMLTKSTPSTDVFELNEAMIGTPTTLSCQFATRQVFVIADSEEEKASLSDLMNYWLAPPSYEDFDQDGEQVMANMMDIAKKYIPSLDLVKEVQKTLESFDVEETATESKLPIYKDPNQKVAPHTMKEFKGKKTFVAPLRGRAFVRGIVHHNRSDPFRSRPPNTSRPPSMHVDDFVALESTGQQPTGPTGYNPQTKRAVKEGLVRSRGRGRSFGTDRPRYLNSPAVYNRRELMRGRGGAVRPLSSRSCTNSPNTWVNNNRSAFRPVDNRLDNRDNRLSVTSRFTLRGGRNRPDWMGRMKDKDKGAGRGRKDARQQRSFTR